MLEKFIPINPVCRILEFSNAKVLSKYYTVQKNYLIVIKCTK